MLVSVVVPAYNEEKYIIACLAALARQRHAGFEVEVIVVDNNSTDATSDVARAAGVRVVAQPLRGVAWARQAGFAAARGEIIASTDADSAPPPDWLERLVAALTAEPGVVGVFGPLRLLDGTRLENLGQCYGIGAVMAISAALGRPTFCGPNFAVRREAWERVGGFDTNWASAEDVNLSLKLVRIGKVRYCHGIQVPTSTRRRMEGVGRLMRNSAINYVRVVWLRRPPIPLESYR